MAEPIPLKSGEKQEQSETEVTLDEGHDTLTDEEVDQLKQFKVKEGSVVWMQMGMTGAGKSCLGNFILGNDNDFAESVIIMMSETKTAALKCSSFDNKNICVIDTPGLGDTGNVGQSESGSEDVAYDYSKLATELTKVMMMDGGQGINAFLVVVPANNRDYRGLQTLLDFCDIVGNYWDHSILVITQGRQLGKTEKEQYEVYQKVVNNNPRGPAPLKKLMKKVSGRLVIVESKDWRDRPEYHRSVVEKIMKYSKEITVEQHGPFKDKLQSIGRDAYEKAKLELRNEFDDIDSSKAQAAVFRNMFKHVREVVYKLVRIKMAGGVDVDQLKEMAKIKEESLNEVRGLRDLLQKEFQEEKISRRKAEEKSMQDNIARIDAERKTQTAVEKTEAAEKEERKAKAEKEDAVKAKRRALKEKEDAEKAEERALKEKEDAVKAQERALKEKEDAVKAQERALKEKEDAVKAEERALKEKEDAVKAEGRALKEKEDAVKAEGRALKEKEDAVKAEGRALKEKEDAEKAEGRALKEKDDAEKAKGRALKEKEDAVKAEGRALKEKEAAEKAEGRALQQKDDAEKAEGRALQKKQDAEKDNEELAKDNKRNNDWIQWETSKGLGARLKNVAFPSKGPRK